MLFWHLVTLLDSMAAGKNPKNVLSFQKCFLPENDVLECAHYFFYKNRFISIHKKALPRGIFYQEAFCVSIALKSYLHRKLYFAILLHFIYNEWMFDLKKKLYFVFKILRFLCFWWSYKLQVLWYNHWN